MNFGENLRKQSKEMREHVSLMLDRLTARPSFLKERLNQLSVVEDVPDSVKGSLQALAEEFGDDSKLYVSLMTGIAGAVTANVYDALADLTDYLSAKGSLKPMVDKLKENREFQSAIRAYAASGDWSGFDAYIENYVKGQSKA